MKLSDVIKKLLELQSTEDLEVVVADNYGFQHGITGIERGIDDWNDKLVITLEIDIE